METLVLGDILLLTEGPTETLVDVLGDTLVEILVDVLGDTLVDVLTEGLAETLVDVLVDTLKDVLGLIEILGDLLTEGLGKTVIVEHTHTVPAALVVPKKGNIAQLVLWHLDTSTLGHSVHVHDLYKKKIKSRDAQHNWTRRYFSTEQ